MKSAKAAKSETSNQLLNRIALEPDEIEDDEFQQLKERIEKTSDKSTTDFDERRTVDFVTNDNLPTTTEPLFEVKVDKGKKRKAPASNESRWFWTDKHVNALLSTLKDFKTFCDYKGINFEGDGPQLHANVRKNLAKSFPACDFGQEKIDEKDKQSQSFFIKRVRDKIVKIRSLYRQSVKENRRSGGGKVVTENWDTLVFLWGGSPSVTSLPSGVKSAEVTTVAEERNDIDDDEETREEDDNEEPTLIEKNSGTELIIDNKRKHLEKPLSSKQRDMLYLNMARDDIRIKEAMVKNLSESSKNIAESIDKMATAMGDVGRGIEKGLGMIAAALGGMNREPTRSRNDTFNGSFSHAVYDNHQRQPNYNHYTSSPSSQTSPSGANNFSHPINNSSIQYPGQF